MPFLAGLSPLITSAIIGGGASVVGGALANKGSKSSSQPTLSPELQPLQGDMISTLMKRLQNPGAGIDPLKFNAMDQVNAGYSGMPARVSSQLAKRGFAQSGTMGGALKGLEIARGRDLSQVGATYDKMGLDQETNTMNIINQMLSSGRGVSSSTSGNMLGGAVGAGSETLTTMLLLDKLMKGGGGGTGGFMATPPNWDPMADFGG